jgi:hypothetical protein
VGDLVTRRLTESEWNRWDAWLAQHPWGSPFSSAWWLEANCRAFGGYPLLLGVFDGEQLAGGVALRVRDTGPLKFAGFSILYNPIVIAVGGYQRRQRVLGVLLDDMARRRLVIPGLTCTPDMVDLREAAWHHWDVTASWTVVTALKTWTLENSVSYRERRLVNRAERSKIVARVEPTNIDLLCDLVTSTMVRQGAKLHESRGQLRTLIESVGSHGMQVVVRDVDSTPLSTVFIMFHGARVAFEIWAGTSQAGLAKGAGAVQFPVVLKELQVRGYEYFDWCGANLPGVSDFKLEFGGTLTTRLTVSRQPSWFKTAFAGYHYAKRIRTFLKRRTV